MPNVDDIINRLLADRRIQEGAAFSSRSYTDQPIIERGSDLKARMDRRRAERGERHQHDAAERREQRANTQAQATYGSRPSPAQPTQPAQATYRRPEVQAQPIRRPAARPSEGAQNGKAPVTRLSDLSRKFNEIFGINLNVAPEPLPEPIRKMRELQQDRSPRELAYGSSASAWLFYQQAHLMASYEDNYDRTVTFNGYYPTYASMTDQELRAYFAWRTKVRAGHIETDPYSFAYVYLYELLCGAGTTPGVKALSDMQDFALAYRKQDPVHSSQLTAYLGRWMRDYAIYHHLERVIPKRQDDLREAVLTLVAAEYNVLESQGREPRVKSPWTALVDVPSTEQLFEALGTAATYRASGSRLMHDEPELFQTVAADTFREMVLHCSKRRKTDYVEGLFGYAVREPYTMFSAAVFYDPEPHPDATILLGKTEGFVCKEARWYHIQATTAHSTNKELGLLLHAIDYEIREAISYSYPLKQRKVPAYIEKLIKKAVAARLAEREEAERRRITIDRSKLSSIRSAAALTRDALLTDEDRGEEVFEPTLGAFADLSALKDTTDKPAEKVQEPGPSDGSPMQIQLPGIEDAGAPEAEAEEAQTVAPPPATTAATIAQDGPLTELEQRFLSGLMDGKRASELLLPTDPFVSVVADSINEKLYDLVGDAVIDFDGDEPVLVEDYLDDIKEVLAP